jgi:GT2 family glycosyltransferase
LTSIHDFRILTLLLKRRGNLGDDREYADYAGSFIERSLSSKSDLPAMTLVAQPFDHDQRQKPHRASSQVGVVVIGRNEGERLKQCLTSVSAAAVVVYVDSGSTDGSVQWARQIGVDVIELDMHLPFTAARARNAGFRRICDTAPDFPYVQFVDGDCELDQNWIERGAIYLDLHGDIGAVCGRRRERYPEKSIFNWLCDLEWDRPAGEERAFGGDVMIRSNALEAVRGYRDDVIAAEDDELSVRLREAGWRIWRLESEMTIHDADITHFKQWWRRALRGGYGFALGAYLHGIAPKRHFVWESRRAWLWGIVLPLACITCGLMFGRWGWATWLVYPLQILRQTVRGSGRPSDRVKLALFQVLARFPEALGQLRFIRDRILGYQPRIIEYK